MKKFFLLLSIAIAIIVCGNINAQNVTPAGKKAISTKAISSPVKSNTVTLPQNGLTSNPNVISSTLGNNVQNRNTAVNYDKDGDVISVDGWKISFITPNNPQGSNACGTPYPYVNVPGNAKNGSCPFDVACDNPVNRDANIPGGGDPIQFMQLRWTIFLDGGGSPSSNIDMNRVDDLMTELNADFLPWKLQFCLDTAIFVSNATYYTFNGGSEEDGMKSTYGANFNNVINIYVVNTMTNPSAGGYAYFPYSGYGGTNYRGGVVMGRNNSSLGTHTLAHELGHTFGLHHTFHGVDEVAVCSACYEDVGASDGSPASGDDHGDRCSDTNPHETNSYSCNPNPGGNNGCDAFPWANVPVDNHMSYSFCSSQFTSQQAGRMHCMINAYMPSWLTNGGVTCGSLPPVADFIGSPIIWPAPSNVSFTNLTAGKATVTNWAWNFDVQGVGGVTPATSTLENPPAVTYANPGLYEVSLTATNPNGTDAIIKSDYIEVAAPVGDCDTLDFQWETPTSTITYYIYDGAQPYDSLITGIPCMYYNNNFTDSIEWFEKYTTPTPGSSKVGAVRLAMGFLADNDNDITFDVSVYNDNGNGKPDYIAGPIGGEKGLSPSTYGFPGYGYYGNRWISFNNAVTLPGSYFHIGVKVHPGDPADTLILFSSVNGQGEGDSSNHALTTNFGLINYQNDVGLDFDLAIIPLMGEADPDPIITSFGQIRSCDTTQVFLYDTVLFSSINSWQITFSDGTTWTDTTNPGTLIRTYSGAGPDTITLSASNDCGRTGSSTYIIPYGFNETPIADFSKDMNNPICMPPPTTNCATFTASPSGMKSYDWDFGDGSVFTDTSQVIQYCYTTTGSYYVEVDITAYGTFPTDTIFYEDFSTGLGSFATFDVDGLNPSVNPPFDGTDGTAWVGNDPIASGDAISTSWYSPAGSSDDWMISPAITINATSSLYWEARNLSASYPDGYEVRISTSSQTVAGCLANPALFTIAAENAYSSPRSVDLAAAGYANQTVYIAFRNISTDMYILSIDEILVGSSGSGCSANLLRTDFVDIIDCSVTLPTAAMNTSTPSSGCDSVTITFTDNSTGSPTSWLWDFNDGNFSTAQNPPPHTFSGAGTYNVILIATNSGGTDSALFTVNVNTSPAMPTAGTDATYCEGDVITDLTATGTAIEWFSDISLTNSLGTGSPFSPTIIVGTNTYYVTDTENGCQSLPDSVVLVVNQAATASAGASTSICEGASHTLSGSIGGSAVSSVWSSSGTGTFDDSTIVSATYTPSTADLNLGSVILTITTDDPDGAGPCVASTDNITLTINSNPNAVIGSSTDILCTGDATGSVTASVTGGVGPYTYIWSDPALQTNITATGLYAGQVGVLVTDANGCQDTVTTVLTQPSLALSGITGTIDATCGNPDGTAYITASGGTGSYTFQWDDSLSQTADTAYNLAAGPYNVTVTDGNNCTFVASASVSDAGAPSATITNVFHVTCFGANNGSAEVNATGGAPPYTYLWSTGGSSSSETNMPGGSHSATVTDNAGCALVVNVTINEPAAITISSELSNDISCNGLTDGTITIVGTGGTGTLEYSIDSGITYPNTNGSFSGLGTGSYIIAVRDSNGCITTGSTLIISEPIAISIITENSADLTCNGNADGTITIVATGGVAPLSYSIDGGSTYPNTSGSFTGLGPGTYNIAVQDSNGCNISGSVLVINEPGAISIISENATDITCNGDGDGTITIAATGGAGTLSYSIDGGSTYPNTSGSFTGLGPGTYNISVQDSNGCNISGSMLTITEPAAFTSNTNAVPSNCGQGDGQASVAVFGGTGPFTFLWDDTGNSTTDTITGLGVGVYNVTATDLNGCISISSATITDAGVGTSTASVVQNATCFGGCDGSATVTITGGATPLTYLWHDPAAQTVQTAIGLCADEYIVDVTDANGCVLTDSVTIVEPPELMSTLTTTDATSGSCNGTATITAAGGTGSYTYLWDDPLAQTNATATGLCPGSITVIVTDANGCGSSKIDSIGTVIGISELVNPTRINIYPNPNQGSFEVEYKLNTRENVNIYIYNNIGEIVLSYNLGVSLNGVYTINMHSQTNGIYYIQLATDSKIWNKKISLIK